MNATPRTLAQLSALAFSAGLFASCKGADPAKDKTRPTPAIAAWIARDTVVDKAVQGVGTLVPEAQVDLRAEIAGRVAAIGFKEGQPVRKGQLLVKIVDADLAASRDKAKAVAEFQRQTLSRRREQLAVQAVAQQDVDAAVQGLASAQADLALAEAMLAKTEIRAPFSGSIGLTNSAVGQYLTPGQTVATMASLRPIRVEFQVPGDDVSRVKPGMELQFRQWGAREFKTAKIYATDPGVDSVSRTLRIRALWTGETGGLVAGTAVEVKIGLSKAKTILMPPQGLGADARGPSVLVLRGGKATPVQVAVGRRTADAVEIVTGLVAGDTVLCNGAVPVKLGSVVVPSRYL